ncbi:hypothetical protein Tco_0528851 [Tanacetum coccineum]
MAPKRATRTTPVTTTPATTTTVTNAQLQAMINQGVSAALAARDATRNGTDSHSSGTGVRGSERVARECTYQDFMKCKPLYFKGTEGVVELTQWFERMETTTTTEAAHAMPWAALKKMMTDKYCPREEIDKVEKYIGGLPDMILGSVKASKSKTMQEVIEFTTELMEDKTHAYVERQAERKEG